MTVWEFFVHTKGARRFSFSENDPSMCGQDFWHKYRDKPVWNAEIASVELMPKRREIVGDTVICLIRLKSGDIHE